MRQRCERGNLQYSEYALKISLLVLAVVNKVWCDPHDNEPLSIQKNNIFA